MSKLRDLFHRAVSPGSSSSSKRNKSTSPDASPSARQTTTSTRQPDSADNDPNGVASRIQRLSISSRPSTEHTIPRKPVPNEDEPRSSIDAEEPTPEPQARHTSLPAASQSLKDKLKGKLNLENKTETIIHETVAPAVTHESVEVRKHEIRHEVIDREIHTHEVHHRVLPVIDVQVLPAKHYVPGPDGRLVQILESQIPGRTAANQSWVIAETVSKTKPDVTQPRKFTARTFGEADADVPEYVDANGIRQSKTTWIHPPEIETGGEKTGQTVPFYFGTEKDGLRS